MDLLSDSDQSKSKSNSPKNDSGFVDLNNPDNDDTHDNTNDLIKKLQVVMLRKHFLK